MDPDQDVNLVSFRVISAKEIRRLAVVDIFEPMLYEKGLPRLNSVLDTRMGSVDRRYVCATCKHAVGKCPGHYGKIELNATCYNPVFIEVILKMLRSVCFFCSKALLENTKPSSYTLPQKNKKRLASLSLNAVHSDLDFMSDRVP